MEQPSAAGAEHRGSARSLRSGPGGHCREARSPRASAGRHAAPTARAAPRQHSGPRRHRVRASRGPQWHKFPDFGNCWSPSAVSTLLSRISLGSRPRPVTVSRVTGLPPRAKGWAEVQEAPPAPWGMSPLHLTAQALGRPSVRAREASPSCWPASRGPCGARAVGAPGAGDTEDPDTTSLEKEPWRGRLGPGAGSVTLLFSRRFGPTQEPGLGSARHQSKASAERFSRGTGAWGGVGGRPPKAGWHPDFALSCACLGPEDSSPSHLTDCACR